MAILNSQLTTTQLDLINVPGGKSYAITNILVCNNGVAGASFDMHLMPSGTALNNAVTRVINNLELPPGETFTFDSERIVINTGDKLSFVSEPDLGGGSAGKTSLSVTVSYLEV
jgi:hypothetical protein|tara:strand:- start:562 stop:903 length:342 start_codon:yes stop_codon:yes gene_type:complete